MHLIGQSGSLNASEWLIVHTIKAMHGIFYISLLISWLPEFLLSSQVKLITNKPSMT